MTISFRTYIYIFLELIFFCACNKEETPVNLPPFVSIEEAKDITRTSAILSGTVIPNEGSTVNRIQFRYGPTPDMLEFVNISITEKQEVSTTLTNLKPGTTYYYCLEAGNKYSTVCSEIMTFKTQPNTIPTVSDLKMLNQGPISITLEYEILDDGGEEIISSGFYLYSEKEPQEQQISLTAHEGNKWKGRIGNLQMDITYYIQAYATNSIGEIRSKTYQFHTGEAVILTEAGTLNEAIGEQEKYQFSTLNIAGPLNGTDIRYLRDMMGIDINGENTSGKLQELNLNDASIVAGGISYDGYRYTVNNIVSHGMFSNCKILQKITLPANTSVIEENSFENCTALTILRFSPDTKEINPSAGCSSLSSLEVPSGSPYFKDIDGVLYNKDATSLIWFPESITNKKFEVPSSVQNIGAFAFRNCHLQQVILPSSVINIGKGAFTASLIESIIIPDEVATIPYGCFQLCKQLVSVTLGVNTSYVSEYCFDQCQSLQFLKVKANLFPPYCLENTFGGAEFLFEKCQLQVPASSLSIYRNHGIWGKFKKIVGY